MDTSKMLLYDDDTINIQNFFQCININPKHWTRCSVRSCYSEQTDHHVRKMSSRSTVWFQTRTQYHSHDICNQTSLGKMHWTKYGSLLYLHWSYESLRNWDNIRLLLLSKEICENYSAFPWPGASWWWHIGLICNLIWGEIRLCPSFCPVQSILRMHALSSSKGFRRGSEYKISSGWFSFHLRRQNSMTMCLQAII